MSCEKDNGKGEAVKEFTFLPVLTSLLKPTAEYLGGELRDFVRDLREKRRAENLKAHLRAVQDELGSGDAFGGGVGVRQFDFFEAWVESVQSIDPSDTELSAIWQRLLIDAVKGGDPWELMSVLKVLTPAEAKLISDCRNNVFIRTVFSLLEPPKIRFLVSSLSSKGVLEKTPLVITLGAPLLLFSVIAMAFIMLYLSDGAVDVFSGDNMWYGVGAISMGVVLVVYNLAVEKWRFTWVGLEFARLAAKDGGR